MARTNNNLSVKKEENLVLDSNITHTEALDEASNLLKNGILVETNKGLVCMSLNDALSSNLNLSAEDLQEVATQLILQENLFKENIDTTAVNIHLNPDFCSTDIAAESDDPTSESNDTFSGRNDFPNKLLYNIKNDAITNLCGVSKLPVIYSEQFTNFSSQPGTSSDSESNVADTANKCIANLIGKNKNVSPHKVIPKLDHKASFGCETNEVTKPLLKRKGGWPKGRKRKPELLHLPPKAPATGYNLFLNEMRKTFNESSLPFYEITKILGNRWSSLSLEEKKPYLDRAEEEKKRYREELRTYRQSGAYQLYLARKRKKRAQNNVLSESDMDATDDIDDEDNEELYCRTCDQWFHNLHNKKEHLQGRQHLQAVAGDMSRELGLDYNLSRQNQIECNTNAVTDPGNDGASTDSSSENVAETMANLLSAVSRREREIKTLTEKAFAAEQKNANLCQQLCLLKEQEMRLEKELSLEKEKQKYLESQALGLLGVTYLFND